MHRMRYILNWSEKDILRSISSFNETTFLKLGGNSFCHKIIKTLQRSSLLTENAGHDCLPPDFFSDDLNIMFDVMRVNDSEKKKGYNPVFKETSEFMKKIQRERNTAFDLYGITNVGFDLESDNRIDYDEIHQFKYYKKQTIRVITEHIKKIPIWCAEHSSIKRKGFVILDETGTYLQGHATPRVIEENGNVNQWNLFLNMPIVVHLPWRDKEFMEPLFQANLEFVVWYKPYAVKSIGNTLIHQSEYSNLAIIDLRKNMSISLQQYDTLSNWVSC